MPELHLGVLRRDGRRLEVEEGFEAVELRLDRAEEGHVAVAEKERVVGRSLARSQRRLSSILCFWAQMRRLAGHEYVNRIHQQSPLPSHMHFKD